MVLAEMAKGRMRRKIPELAQALEGHFDAHHARLARSILSRLDHVQASLIELDEVISMECAPWQHQIDLLQTMPGIGPRVAQTVIAETGADMTRFPTANHLASWVGLAPGRYESAGRSRPAGSQHGNKWLKGILTEAAGAIGRMHGRNYLAAQYARLSRTRGASRARNAVAHSMIVIIWHMLSHDQPYQDLGPDWLTRRNTEARTRRLVAQLEQLGHTVIIDPAA